ncbi:MAG: hypothetical protein C5S47_04220 [Candidatus Methanogasteraceae archaeon]|nr:MAG: hypothetical protein C5S47_04220 [ANME-2 cluster archaeon]
MTKKIEHEDAEGTESCFFSLCPLSSLRFSESIPESDKKSHKVPYKA